MKRGTLFAAVLLTWSVGSGPACADEGMWLFNEFPFARFEKAYGFRPTQAWLDHLRLASVRFNSGGSGSFVSAEGLVLTNHHVGADCVQSLSGPGRDYLKDGLVAATRAEEKACPDLELNVLESIERVSARVKGAVKPGATPGQANDQIQAEMAAIEKECADQTGLRCDVINLYHGGEYDLHRFHRYTDIRVAFSPELQLAYFGGDPDNFEFPRYDVDIALFRVYDGGKPLRVEHFLRFNPQGPKEGEVTFVSGHPGSTGRFLTLAQLEYLRDTDYPLRLAQLNHNRDLALQYSALGGEQARQAQDDLLSIENSIKAYSGYQAGLLNAALIDKRQAAEKELRHGAAADGDPWTAIANAQEVHEQLFARRRALDAAAHAGHLSTTATDLVLLTAELAKPNGERLREYRESNLPSVYQELYSEAPIYPEYEEWKLAAALRVLRSQFGNTHPLVVEVLGKEPAETVAKRLVAGTKLADVAERRRLAEGGRRAIEASSDPMIAYARRLEGLYRELRDRYENEVQGVERTAGAQVAEAYFARHGKEAYPDATFTLRLSYGKAVGWEEAGKPVPFQTNFAGMLERSEKFGNQPPFDLPRAVVAARGKLDLQTPVDFVSTNDIIGGSSGSPVVNRAGEFVGIIFDGNLYMLPNRFVYSEEKARAISVHSAAILATLRTLYPAEHLAKELVGK